MNAKFIEGLKAVRDGIDLILENTDGVVVSNVKETESTAERGSVATTKKSAPVEEKATTSTTEGITREQLDGMTYNNLKKFAKTLGIPAVGNRDEITNNILGADVEAPAEEEDTPVVEETPVEKTSKKLGKKAPEVEEEPEEENDPVYAKVLEAVEEMSNEDIADVLADIGISAKGKREALIDKIVKAVKDGLLELDGDEDDEDGEEVPAPAPEKKTAKKEPEPIPEEDEDEEEDDTNDIENPDMTEERKVAILAQDEDIRKQFKTKKVTRKELVKFLQQFYDTNEAMDDISDDGVLDTYIDAVCRLIDDSGEFVEEGAYELNSQPACCGRVLAYTEDTGMFICEHCGEEYEADEE